MGHDTVGLTDAAKIRIFRALHGLGQVEFGHFMGADRPAVAKWEAGVYLPRSEEMIRIGIYNWIRVEGILPPQLFVPILPNVHVRPQSINHFMSTIQEILPSFCVNEKIKPGDTEIINFDDGTLIRLGCHVIIALGPLRSIGNFLPAELNCKPKTGEGRLTTIILEKQTTLHLLKTYFRFNAQKIEEINWFRAEAALWDRMTVIPFSVTIKGISPSHHYDVINMIKQTVEEKLSEKYKDVAPRFSVNVDFPKI